MSSLKIPTSEAEIKEALRQFSPNTRKNLQRWQRELKAKGITGRPAFLLMMNEMLKYADDLFADVSEKAMITLACSQCNATYSCMPGSDCASGVCAECQNPW